jgi:hypothetical protein
MEVQGRLEELELKIALRKVRITRNYQPWNGGLEGNESRRDVFSERLGGSPKKSNAPPPRPPPSIPREKRRIFLDRRFGKLGACIDPEFDLLRNLMTIASVPGILDPSDWNLMTVARKYDSAS